MRTFFFIIIFSLIIDIGVYAQKQISFYFAPTASYRKFTKDLGINDDIGMRFDVGLKYQFFIKEKLFVGSGLTYSRMGYNYKVYYEEYGIGKIKIELYRDFLELPILFSYQLYNKKKNKFFIDFNLRNQLFVQEKTKMGGEFPDDLNLNQKKSFSDLRDSDFKLYNIAIQLGFTYQRQLNDKFSLNISPFYKYGLLDMANIHDLSFGIKLGIGYWH